MQDSHLESVTPRRSKQSSSKPNKKKKYILYALIVIALLSVCAFIFRKQLLLVTFDTLFKEEVQQVLDQSYDPLDDDDQDKPQPVADQDSPFSLLLLGTDQRKDEPARSDTLIYTVVRPKDQRMLLISIPRDSYAEIVGYGKKSKINSAYAHGGAKMTVDTVSHLFEQPVHYYAAINFVGLIDIVNTLGGVELPITKDIVNKQKDHDKFTIKANKPIYDGEEALNYVRYREDSDFNRTARQRTFISQLFARFTTFGNLTKLDDVMRIGGSNLKTNMRSDRIIELAKSSVSASPQLTNYMLKGKDDTVDGIYYYRLDNKDLKFVHTLIEQWLSPDTTDEELANSVT